MKTFVISTTGRRTPLQAIKLLRDQEIILDYPLYTQFLQIKIARHTVDLSSIPPLLGNMAPNDVFQQFAVVETLFVTHLPSESVTQSLAIK